MFDSNLDFLKYARQHIKKQRHHSVDKSQYSQSYGFSSSHVWMWELNQEGWVLKNWCFEIGVLEKTLESPLDSKEIKPVHPKGNQSWMFIGRTDADWSWNSNTLATWFEELTHGKRPWCWERLKAEGEGHDRGWDGWMASLTPWTWVWASSGSWWWTGRLFIYFGNQSLFDYIICKYFLQLCRVPCHVSCGSLCCAKASELT